MRMKVMGVRETGGKVSEGKATGAQEGRRQERKLARRREGKVTG